MTIRPWPDEVFDATAANKFDIARRDADEVAALLAEHVIPLARALGVDGLQPAGTESVAGGDPVDVQLVSPTRDLRSTITHFRSGDLSAYLVHARHLSGTEVQGRHERLLFQRGGLSVCEVVVFASLRRALAGDTELDEAHVRLNSGLDTVLGGALTALVEALRFRPEIAVDPDGDIAGVDLAGGRATGSGTRRASIEWDLRPTPLDEVIARFEQYVGRCFELFGLGPVPTFEITRTRSRGGPADGPFSDLTRSSGVSADGRVRLSIAAVEARWNERVVDHVSATLDMRTATDRLRAVASGRSGSDCLKLQLARPTSGTAVEELWAAFEDRLATQR